MHTMTKGGIILSTLLVALAACTSEENPNDVNSDDSLVGDWNGRCITTDDRDGSTMREDANTTIQFTQDGKYSRSSTGHHGGRVAGDYTISGQTITVTSDGEPVTMEYFLNENTLTTEIEVFLPGVRATSRCELQRRSEG